MGVGWGLRRRDGAAANAAVHAAVSVHLLGIYIYIYTHTYIYIYT